MRKLTKKDRRRFDDVCKRIREALLLDHLQHEYEHLAKDDDKGTIATTHVFGQGWRLKIYIRPVFWKYGPDEQLRSLIHEHVHVALHPYHQAIDHIERHWVSSHCLSQVQEKQHVAAEICIDHLTEVFYRVLKDRF